MAQKPASDRRHSQAYELFIFVLTIISLVNMLVMLLPLDDATIQLLQFYDFLICIIFLIDFFLRLRAAPRKSAYFFRERGWLDLLGSIPSLGLSKYASLLRLARLSRLARIWRSLKEEGGKRLLADVVRNRSHYTAYITILSVIIVLASASVLVLEFEGESPDSKITTGKDAFWYSMVTITTVGYGDYYPVTSGGRATAVFVMIAGVGLIGVLASLLSSLLTGSSSEAEDEETPDVAPAPAVEAEMAAMRNELAALRQWLEQTSAGDRKQPTGHPSCEGSIERGHPLPNALVEGVGG